MINFKPVLLLCSYLLVTVHGAYKLQERYSWNQLDFVFPSQQMKDIAIASGNYIPQNALPVGIEHWGNKLFVTVPRWKDGKTQEIISIFWYFKYRFLVTLVEFWYLAWNIDDFPQLRQNTAKPTPHTFTTYCLTTINYLLPLNDIYLFDWTSLWQDIINLKWINTRRMGSSFAKSYNWILAWLTLQLIEIIFNK